MTAIPFRSVVAEVPEALPLEEVRVTLDERDVSEAFSAAASSSMSMHRTIPASSMQASRSTPIPILSRRPSTSGTAS